MRRPKLQTSKTQAQFFSDLFTSFKAIAANSAKAGLALGLVMAAGQTQAQEHLIGEGQSVNRVIKLRSASSPLQQKPAVNSDKTSRSVQTKSITRKQGTKNGIPQVASEAITPGTVPAVLQSTRTAPTRAANRVESKLKQPLVESEPIGKRQNWSTLQTPVKRTSTRTESNPVQPVSVNNAAPILNTLIEAPKYINLNQTATIRIKLQNAGGTTTRQAKLVATLPAHAKFVRSTPTPSNVNGQILEFRVSNITGQQAREIAIDLIPTQKLPLEIDTDVVVENSQRIAVGVREPRLQMELSGPKTGNIGQSLAHEVVVKNTGDGTARDIRVQAAFPAGLVSNQANPELVIPFLEPGETEKVSFHSLAKQPGQAPLSVQALATGIETQTAQTMVTVYQPELQILASGPKMNFVDREGMYTVKINNTGEVDVTNVNIVLQVPHGMQVTTISREASVDAESGLLMWKFDKIDAKSEQLIQLKTLAIAEGQQVCNIIVSSNETREKEMQVATNVATRADVAVSINNDSGPIQVGGKAQFTVVVENKGSSSANDIAVNVELPPSLTPIKQDGVEVQEFGNTVTFRDSQIEPGQKRQFTFKAAGVKKGEHVVRSVLQTGGSESRIAVEGSVYVYEVSEVRVSESLSPVIPR